MGWSHLLVIQLMVLGVCQHVTGTGQDHSSRPNIIVLLTDDQRWDTVGRMGNPVIQTPNLDRLADQGTLFGNCFVTSAVCSISRASIFTGQHMRRHGIADFETPLPGPAFKRIYPMILQRAGYRIGFIGKWGVGKSAPLPNDQFDYWDGFSGQGKYFDASDPQRIHLTTKMTRSAVRFIRSSASDDRPFCLSVSFKAPHAEWKSFDPKLKTLYEDVELPVTKTVTRKDWESMPWFISTSRNSTKAVNWIKDRSLLQDLMRRYYRLVTGVDMAVGVIRAALDSVGLADNTVIIFTSDNGLFFGEHGLNGKWLMYEEAIRVPLIIYDPRPDHHERVSHVDQMALNIDLAPTILEISGAAPEPGMQGRSLVPLLKGPAKDWRKDWFYENHLSVIIRSEGVRTDKWKYIRYIDREPVYEELYDLAADPHERHNLAERSAHQKTLAALRGRWAHYSVNLK